MSIKTYRKRINKLTKKDIENNTAIKFISDNGVIVSLKYSWIELIIDLVTELSVLKDGKVSKALVDANINNNSIIAVKKGIKIFGLKDNTQYIINDTYNIIINTENINYREVIIKLLLACKIDIKSSYIEYKTKTSTDDNILSNNLLEKNIRDLIKSNSSLDGIKPYKISINNSKYSCYSKVGIARALILYIISKDKQFINKVDKEFIQFETENNKLKISIKYKGNSLIEYIETLLNNENIISQAVTLYYKQYS